MLALNGVLCYCIWLQKTHALSCSVGRYVEGGDVNEAKQRLIDIWQLHHDAERQFLLACKQLIQYVLEVKLALALSACKRCLVTPDQLAHVLQCSCLQIIAIHAVMHRVPRAPCWAKGKA